jgi:hypothetical protein
MFTRWICSAAAKAIGQPWLAARQNSRRGSILIIGAKFLASHHPLAREIGEGFSLHQIGLPGKLVIAWQPGSNLLPPAFLRILALSYKACPFGVKFIAGAVRIPRLVLLQTGRSAGPGWAGRAG